jgi:hypothetical protein
MEENVSCLLKHKGEYWACQIKLFAPLPIFLDHLEG